ncbi:MAG: serine/threonine protein phosphatase [Deltaproteobacteria bacterium]|nr:serine/threonine protein phosphatase [Deltaproteobacteria bacterium]
MGRIFAIGDIHGCYDKLVSLLEKSDIDFAEDTLVFIGDYVDRGPSPYETVSHLVALKKQHENIVFLKGNHEDMLEKYLAGADRFTYLMNGGQITLDGYLAHKKKPGEFPVPQDHLDFYKSLVLYYETDSYLFVHAGLRNKIPLDRQDEHDMLWIRSEFIRSDYDFGKQVVFGHTPFSKPLVQPNKIGIDTGAVYGHELTCVQLPDMIFHQV